MEALFHHQHLNLEDLNVRMINIDIVTSHIFDAIPRKTTHEKHSIRYNGHKFWNLVSDQKCKQPSYYLCLGSIFES